MRGSRTYGRFSCSVVDSSWLDLLPEDDGDGDGTDHRVLQWLLLLAFTSTALEHGAAASGHHATRAAPWLKLKVVSATRRRTRSGRSTVHLRARRGPGAAGATGEAEMRGGICGGAAGAAGEKAEMRGGGCGGAAAAAGEEAAAGSWGSERNRGGVEIFSSP